MMLIEHKLNCDKNKQSFIQMFDIGKYPVPMSGTIVRKTYQSGRGGTTEERVIWGLGNAVAPKLNKGRPFVSTSLHRNNISALGKVLTCLTKNCFHTTNQDKFLHSRYVPTLTI